MEEEDFLNDLFGEDEPASIPSRFEMPSSTPRAKPYPNLAPESEQYKKHNFVPRKRKFQRVVSAEENGPSLRMYLKRHWGHDDFRGQQSQVCHHVMKGHDVLVVAPTGLGKSVCFQVPAIAVPGITLVVSPIIALMKDQLQGLEAKGIPAAMLSSKSAPEETKEIMRQLRMGYPVLKLLYVTPERMSNETFRAALRRCYEREHLNRLVIDEAHVIEEWGLTFRKEYRKLSDFRKDFPKIPITALTASATEQVREDICDLLGMKSGEWAQFVDPTNRVNLFYEIRHGSKGFTPDWKATNIAEFIISWRPEAMARMKKVGINVPCVTGLVYCRKKSSCDDVAEILNKRGIKARVYYASLKEDELTAAISDWKEGRLECIVATIAFGMGVDQPNVRYVVHYDMPKSFEGYYQETGRAGRDGHLSRCVMYFSREDAQVVRNSVQMDADKAARSEESSAGLDGAEVSTAKKRCVDSFKHLWHYAENEKTCRHVVICRYFGEEIDDSNEQVMKAYCDRMCDICVNPGAVLRGRSIVNANIPVASQVVPWKRQEMVTIEELSSPMTPVPNSLADFYSSGVEKSRPARHDLNPIASILSQPPFRSTPSPLVQRADQSVTLSSPMKTGPERMHPSKHYEPPFNGTQHVCRSSIQKPVVNDFTKPIRTGPWQAGPCKTIDDIAGNVSTFALPTVGPSDPQKRQELEEKVRKQREEFERIPAVEEDFAAYYNVSSSSVKRPRGTQKSQFKTPFLKTQTSQPTLAPTASLTDVDDEGDYRRQSLMKLQEKLQKSIQIGGKSDQLWDHWGRQEVGEARIRVIKRVGRNLESSIAEEAIDQKDYHERVNRTIKVMRLFRDPKGVQTVLEGTFGQDEDDKEYAAILQCIEELFKNCKRGG